MEMPYRYYPIVYDYKYNHYSISLHFQTPAYRALEQYKAPSNALDSQRIPWLTILYQRLLNAITDCGYCSPLAFGTTIDDAASSEDTDVI